MFAMTKGKEKPMEKKPLNLFKICVLLSYISIASLSAAIITPALPTIGHVYHLNNANLQWVVSIFMIGYVLGQLIYGPIANRFGRLAAIRSGLLLNLIGIVICLFASEIHLSYGLLLLGRLVTALGAASGLACSQMLIHDLLPPQKAKHALAYSMLSFTGGVGLAVFLGGILTQYLSWTDCFWLLLIHGIIMLASTRLFPETLQQKHSIHPKTIILHYVHVLKSFRLITFALVVGLLSIFSYGYAATAPIFTQDILHLSAADYGIWNLLNMVGMLLSGILSARLMKRLHESTTLILGFAFIIPGLISLFLLAYSPHANALWFFLTTTYLYLSTGLVFAPSSFIAAHAITDKASASSMLSFINMGSAVIGVLVIGHLPLQSIASFTWTLGVFFIVMLVLAIPQGLKKMVTHT